MAQFSDLPGFMIEKNGVYGCVNFCVEDMGVFYRLFDVLY